MQADYCEWASAGCTGGPTSCRGASASAPLALPTASGLDASFASVSVGSSPCVIEVNQQPSCITTGKRAQVCWPTRERCLRGKQQFRERPAAHLDHLVHQVLCNKVLAEGCLQAGDALGVSGRKLLPGAGQLVGGWHQQLHHLGWRNQRASIPSRSPYGGGTGRLQHVKRKVTVRC